MSPAIVLVRTVSGVQRVVRRCERADAAGVRPEMTLAHARVLLDGPVHVEPFDEARETRSLTRLASWALRFSPIVAPDPPDGLLVDIAGCERLFHGERRLVNLIANSLTRLAVTTRPAVAGTFGCAWAVARFGRGEREIVPAGAEKDFLASFPVASLRLDAEACAGLRELGVAVVGELLRLPRLELVARFGPELLERIDQATGEVFESVESVRRIEPPRVERVFDGPVTQLEGVMLTVRDLVERLVETLERRESGVREIELELRRADAGPQRETLSLSRPSRHAQHLWALLRPRVETIDLGFGVEEVILTATKIGRLPHEQVTRWREGGPEAALRPGRHPYAGAHAGSNGGSGAGSGAAGASDVERTLGEMIDTLASRLGPRRTVRLAPVESHLPERAFTSQVMHDAALDMGTRRPRSDAVIALSERPSHLLHRAEPIEVMALTPDGPPVWMQWQDVRRTIVTSFGPERIGDEWWRETGDGHRISERDYFKVQDDQGRWLWIYRDLATARWFVHGQWA